MGMRGWQMLRHAGGVSVFEVTCLHLSLERRGATREEGKILLTYYFKDVFGLLVPWYLAVAFEELLSLVRHLGIKTSERKCNK
jgi:hypothetical protein